MNNRISNSKIYLSLFLLFLLGLQVILFPQIVFGFNSVQVSDNSDHFSRSAYLQAGNPNNQDYQQSKTGNDFDAYPPGYSIFFAIFNLILGTDIIMCWVTFRVSFLSIFITICIIFFFQVRSWEQEDQDRNRIK